ncbi:hypothetical protein PTTG_11918 [Puccinia triticina 1-1 BBBD Race 1]|uniref:Transmembrane protein n=2 Tax=Puccinia triticina TaxID=208348 RepID=A0A180GK85_PUCT1|nr:uncharacterized protein PtA15_5A16 [Puccinia triticina]OAV92373.1 hypothetical protein PTTG_11918 [Puccinia triticina 1-1 BBBD Race 1]WAQ84446.1 hypothetical protein PtA15_5A16 [Puccinia triticina]WAR57790.1 hypothetical protein PtB15_5B20 [Puccinia triticina]
MAALITTPTFDDGLYHPPNPAPAVTPASTTPVATPVAAAPAPETIPEPPPANFPAVSPISPISSPASLQSVSSFQSTATSISSIPTPSGTSIRPIGVVKPPNQHGSTVAVVVSVFIIVAVFGIIFISGFLTSQRFRLWKEKHWSRYPENKWKVARGRPTSSMGEVSQRESTAGLIADKEAEPFERGVPRQSRLQTFFHIGRASFAGPVEQVDEERGWLWGTRPAKDNLTRLVTPGLGVGKYRSKYGSHTSRGFKYAVGRSVDVPELSTHEATSMAPGESLYEEKEEKEELFYDYAARASSAFDYDQYSSNQGDVPPTGGVSYLLTRLKDSISGRTKFSSLGSAHSRVRQDSARGRWNEVGRLVNEDEMEHYDEKLVGLEAQSHIPLGLRPDLSLADIALPSVPAYTWDAHSTAVISKQKRSREPTISGTDSREFAEYSSQLLDSHVSSERPLAAKSRKLPPLPSCSATKSVASSTRHQSRGIHKSRSAITVSSVRQKRKGTSVSGSKKVKAKPAPEVYPGGFVGRSPTKKLRRKASPES